MMLRGQKQKSSHAEDAENGRRAPSTAEDARKAEGGYCINESTAASHSASILLPTSVNAGWSCM